MKGKIIVIEGVGCSGKETQSSLLCEKLNREGVKCVRMSFPMYDTPTGKIVGGSYLGKEEISKCLFNEGAGNVDPRIACLYYAADRKYNINKVLEYLDRGYFVILDRYTTSSLAHQGGKIKDKDERFNMYQWIDKLEYWLLQLPKPDKTIFLHLPYEYVLELKRNRPGAADKVIDSEHLKNAEESYIELCGLYNWDIINCIKDDKIRSIEDISDEILKLVLEFCNKK